MGSGGSVSETMSEDVETELRLMTPHLPIAELLHGGIIRLCGFVGFFNVNSIIEPAWLKGKITVEQYQQAIEHINKSALGSQVGLPKIQSITDISTRESRKAEAISHAVAQINQLHKSIKFTYQKGAKFVKLYPVWYPKFRYSLLALQNGSTCTGPESYLYINVN